MTLEIPMSLLLLPLLKKIDMKGGRLNDVKKLEYLEIFTTTDYIPSPQFGILYSKFRLTKTGSSSSPIFPAI